MKAWQKVLKGEIQTSIEIKDEINNLTRSGQEMEKDLPGLERTLKKARQDLLAESPNASDRVKEAEKAISANTSKISAISDILKTLDVALAKALTSETIKKQAEITQEIAAIDDEVSELHKEILENFAKSAVLVNKLHGHERQDQRLSYGFFQRCNLSEELHRQIAAGVTEQQGVSLYTRREQLSREKANS